MNSGNLKKINENDSSVQSHLVILQNVIQRMAENCNSSKTWCVTIVSAILVAIADKNKPQMVWLCIAPILLFCALDIHYLALEKGFRDSYNSFIKKLHSDILSHEDLFAVNPSGKMVGHHIESFLSFSVWAFYLVLLGLVIVTHFLIF
ncbi:MAG: hypothetical protein ACOYL6_17515 [Bacteriovoracaceae bacterium]